MLKKKLVTRHYHLTYPIFLILFLMGGMLIAVSQSQKSQELSSHAATTNCSVSASQLVYKTQEEMMITEINQYRASHGLGALAKDPTLKQAATWQSLDMMTHNKMSHTDSLGRTTDVRLANCGYDLTRGYGESIAEGTAVPFTILTGWENDPSHNQLLLTARYNIIGVDKEDNLTGTTTFWTVDFGTGSSVTPPFVPPTATPVPGVTSTITNNPVSTPTGIKSTPTPTTNPTTVSPTISSTISPSLSPSEGVLSPTLGPITADMLISVSAKINGVGTDGNRTPMHKTRRVTALVYGVGAQPVTTGTAFLSYDGNNYFTGTIHLGKLNQGPYFVKIVGDNTLQVLAKPEFQNLLINRTNPIPPVTLYQGDMNGDNVLDLNDYNLVLPCFQDKTCSNATAIDFNDDGKTDVVDYNLFLQSFEILHGD